MHLTFLTRWIKHLTSQEAGEREAFAGYLLGECNMVVVFCKRLPQLQEVLHFIRKVNDRGYFSHVATIIELYTY